MKLQINNANINYTESKSENPRSEIALVFLHYFGGSSRSWSPLIGLLKNDFRCIAPDLRGFGDSQAIGDYSVKQNADDIAALIQALKLGRYALVGHSMGGKTALSLAARRPAGLEKLILLAPSPPSPEPIPDDERARLLRGHGDRAQATETLKKITQQTLAPELREIVIEDNLKTSRAAWRAWLERGSREDITAQLEKVEVPTSVLGGECDGGMTPELLRREVIERLQNAKLETIDGAAHLLPLESPESVARHIAEFIGI